MRRPGSSGWVRWPSAGVDGWRETGEGGTWVYAFVRVERSQPFDMDIGEGRSLPALVDPFVHCHGPDSTIALTMPDALVTVDSPIYPSEGFAHVAGLTPGSTAYEWERTNFGADVLAAMCLGTTGSTFANDDGPFDCGRDDLTRQGRWALVWLQMLYDRPPMLVTFLDT